MAGPSSTIFRKEYHPQRSDISNSGFYDVEDLQGLVPSDLSNEIHPLFSKDKFPAADFDYEVLETPLRLASHFVERLLPVFYMFLLCEPNRELSDTTPGEYIGIFPEPWELTPEEEAEAREELLHLAKNIRFTLEGDGTEASCETCGLSEDNSIYGFKSVIKINHGLYDRLLEHPKDDLIASFRSAVALARTLAHELVHAADFSTEWSFSQEERYPGGVFMGYTTELGLEAEAWLFGGPIGRFLPPPPAQSFYSFEGKVSSVKGLTYVQDYPDRLRVKQYAEGSIERGTSDIRVRGKPPCLGDVVCLWRVRFLDLANMFYDEFWRSEETIRRTLPFRRTTGYRIDTKKIEMRLQPFVGAVDRITAVPEGFEVDRWGLVRPVGGDDLASGPVIEK